MEGDNEPTGIAKVVIRLVDAVGALLDPVDAIFMGSASTRGSTRGLGVQFRKRGEDEEWFWAK